MLQSHAENASESTPALQPPNGEKLIEGVKKVNIGDGRLDRGSEVLDSISAGEEFRTHKSESEEVE
jgi:hypothetical protein